MLEQQEPFSSISLRQTKPVSYAFKVLNSQQTLFHYKRRMKYFFDYLKLPGADIEEQALNYMSHIKEEDNQAFVEESIINYVDYQKQRVKKHELAASSLKSLYAPIKLFCEMHRLDKSVSWKIISRGLPKGKAASNDRIPTPDEIRKLVEYPDHRIKPIVYIMISSGIRLGAWDYLQWKHVTPIRDEAGKLLAAKLLVYDKEPEEYITFASPQAYNALKKYMDFRASYGEEIKPDSPLIRNIWRTVDIKRTREKGGRVGLATAPKGLSSEAIKRILIRAQVEQGIRPILPKGVRRHEWKEAHGLRKFFETYAEVAGVKTSFVKILMARSQGVEDSYNKPTADMLLTEYSKAIDKLTVLNVDETSSTSQLQKQVTELKEKSREENWEAEQTKKELQELRAQSDRQAKDIKKLMIYLNSGVQVDPPTGQRPYYHDADSNSDGKKYTARLDEETWRWIIEEGGEESSNRTH
jgi:integrase